MDEVKKSVGMVQTVLGPVPANALGPTSTHEHAFLDLSCYVDFLIGVDGPDDSVNDPVTLDNLGALRYGPYSNYDNCRFDGVDSAVKEMSRFFDAGGRTIVDVTNADIGRNPLGLREVSQSTGLHVVAGCGHYVALAHPESLASKSVDDLAHELVDEIEVGIGGTDVRAGIIGEIGTSAQIHPGEEKVLRAAARAQLATGLAITIHTHPPTRRGHDILDILEEEGVALDRVVLGHIDACLGHLDLDFAGAVDHLTSLAERGAYLEFDRCGTSDGGFFKDGTNSWWWPSDGERCKALRALIEHGFERQLLLGQDCGHKQDLYAFGGVGYAHILTAMREMFEAMGLDAAVHDQLTRLNPARMLSGSDI